MINFNNEWFKIGWVMDGWNEVGGDCVVNDVVFM